MTLYLIGTDLFADTSHELVAAARKLRGQRIVRQGAPTECIELTDHQLRIAVEWPNVQLLNPGHGALLLEARRHGVAVDLDQLLRRPSSLNETLAAAAAAQGHLPGWHPHRVQLSRRAGYRLPPRTVSVASPSKYANPFRPAKRSPEANQAAVDQFSAYLQRNPALVSVARTELTGLNLACWCRPDLACHADVWLGLVNNNPEPEGPNR